MELFGAFSSLAQWLAFFGAAAVVFGAFGRPATVSPAPGSAWST